jgi:hypothetical protein
MLAEAGVPVPPSFDVTALVVLDRAPLAVPVTLTEKLHDASALSVAPERLTLPDPAVAVIVPALQLPDRALGVATTSPAGSESVKPTPVSAVPVFGFARLKVKDMLLFIEMVAAPNVLVIVAGEGVEVIEPPLPLPQPLRMTSMPPIAKTTYPDTQTRSLTAARQREMNSWINDKHPKE